MGGARGDLPDRRVRPPTRAACARARDRPPPHSWPAGGSARARRRSAADGCSPAAPRALRPGRRPRPAGAGAPWPRSVGARARIPGPAATAPSGAREESPGPGPPRPPARLRGRGRDGGSLRRRRSPCDGRGRPFRRRRATSREPEGRCGWWPACPAGTAGASLASSCGGRRPGPRPAARGRWPPAGPAGRGRRETERRAPQGPRGRRPGHRCRRRGRPRPSPTGSPLGTGQCTRSPARTWRRRRGTERLPTRRRPPAGGGAWLWH